MCSPDRCDFADAIFRAVGQGAFPAPETMNMQPRILRLRLRMTVPGVGKSYFQGGYFDCAPLLRPFDQVTAHDFCGAQ
jgi:hypothetical protein